MDNLKFGRRYYWGVLVGIVNLAACARNMPNLDVSNLTPPIETQNSDSAPASAAIADQAVSTTLQLLDLPPPLSSLQEVRIRVTGTGLSGYSYGVIKSGGCSETTFSEMRPLEQPISEYLESGTFTVCVKGIKADKTETDVKSYVWEVDSNQPTVFLSGQSIEHNTSGWLLATLQGNHAVSFMYKVVTGTLKSEMCGQDGYSYPAKLDKGILQRMVVDGDHTLCLMGISRTGARQIHPTVVNFLQDAQTPAVSATLDNGGPIPQVVSGAAMTLKLQVLNLANKYTYQLINGSVCPMVTDPTYPAAQSFPPSNEASLTLTQEMLTANLDAVTRKGLKTLCLVSSKPGPDASMRRNLQAYQIYVNTNTIVISEQNVSGLPVNPSTESSYSVTLTPPDVRSNFVLSTSRMYYKVEKVNSNTGMQPCDLSTVTSVKYTDFIALPEITQRGWWRFCVMLENEARTQSNQVTVYWFKENVVAKAGTSPANSTATRRLNQRSSSKTLSQAITVTSANQSTTSTYHYRYKYYVGSRPCHEDSTTLSGEISASTNLSINPLSTLTGTHSICLYGIERDSNGNLVAEQLEPTRYEWFHDQTAPSVTVSGLPNIASNANTITVRVSTAEVGQAYNPASDARTVSFSSVLRGSMASCPARSTTNNPYTVVNVPQTGTSIGVVSRALNLGLTSANDGEKLTLCIYATDSSGNTSSTRSFSWVFDVTAPNANASFVQNIINGTRSNLKSLDLIVQTEGGVVGYRAVIRASTVCTNATYPTTTKTISFKPNTTPQEIAPDTLTLTGADGARTICIRAVDNAGNIQSTTNPTMISWILDTTPAQFTVTGAPAATVSSSSLNVSVSVAGVTNGETVAGYDYVLIESSSTCPSSGYSERRSAKITNAAGQLVSNPINLTTSVPAGTTKQFGLCIRSHDEAGNISAPMLKSWSQTAPM